MKIYLLISTTINIWNVPGGLGHSISGVAITRWLKLVKAAPSPT